MPRVFPFHRLRRALSLLFVLALLTGALAWWRKGTLPGPAEIRPELMAEPLQRPTSREPFQFPYKDLTCSVRPVAAYELHGLVVSHNNIESFADIYHDSTSVDTKDLCVLWGENLASDGFLKVRFWSGPWTCYFKYPQGIDFSARELSNNHLITDSDSVRRQIANVNVGDQVRLEGLLVSYQMDDWDDFWRQTSTTRNDAGCEVLFVESLEVLKRATAGWYLAFALSRRALFLLPILYLLVVVAEVYIQGTGDLGRI